MTGQFKKGGVGLEAFNSFFDVIKNGTYGFNELFAFLSQLWTNVFSNEHIVVITDSVNSVVGSFLPFVLLGVYAAVLLFGKRIFGVVRFVAFFLVGFFLGTYYLADAVMGFFPSIPAFVVGTLIGLTLGVLSKPIYYVLYTVVACYGTYLLCISGTVLPELRGNYVVALIIAAIALTLAFVLRGFIERFGTAFLGAYGIAVVVRDFFDFTAFVPGYEWAVLLGAALFVAAFGYVFQFSTRKKRA